MKRYLIMCHFIKRKILIFLAVIFLQGIILLQAQNFKPEYLINSCKSSELEKVYVHVAKNYLCAGDKLPFTAYIIEEDTSITVKESIILYFDIINNSGNELASWHTNIISGTASGNAYMPDTIPSGVYMLRAYTKWMMNTGNDFIYQIPIYILNLSDDKPALTSEVCYKNSQTGNYIVLKEQEKKLKVNIKNNELSIQIDSLTLPYPANLLGILHEKIILQKRLSDKTNSIAFNTTLTPYQSGNINIVLADNYGRALLEKQAIYHKSTGDKVKITELKQNYKPGDIINLSLFPANAHSLGKIKLSCSITRKANLSFIAPPPSISDYINYFSEYKASSWYNKFFFYGANPDSISYALTWDNAIWNSEISNNFVCSYPKESSAFLLTGKIIDKQTGQAMAGAKILLAVKGHSAYVDYAFSNEKGVFYFWLKKELDNKDLILQVYDEKITNSAAEWEIINDIPQNSILTSTPIRLSANEKQESKEIMQLSLINRIYFEKSDSLTATNHEFSNLTYKPNYTIYPADYEQLSNFKEIADNILPGVALKNKRSGWKIQIIDPNERMELDSGCMVLLNSVPFTDLGYIAKLPVEDIESIDVYQSDIFFGDINYHGIVAIYTKSNALPTNYLVTQTKLIKNTVLPSFNSQIINNTDKNSNIPNFNDLLYWDPQISIDNNHSFSIRVPTTLYKGIYELDIEGVTSKGTPVNIQKAINIE